MTAQAAINYCVCMLIGLDLFHQLFTMDCASSQNDIPAVLAIALQ
jgi:hypothetical protein